MGGLSGGGRAVRELDWIMSSGTSRNVRRDDAGTTLRIRVCYYVIETDRIAGAITAKIFGLPLKSS